eukprot:3434932-Karenia_brevis.AAC.1
MVFLTLMLRPWTQMCKARGLSPRVLADDVTLSSYGDDEADRFIDGWEKTLEYFRDMGAAISTK